MAASERGGKIQSHSSSNVQAGNQDLYDSNSEVLFEQIQSEPYNISYTCFLIPGSSSQQLIGDLAEALPKWLSAICASFEWKLEFVKVTPDYFQWALSVLPAVPTGNILQQVRSRTSELILANDSCFKNDDSSESFWAMGYLILSGVQPDPREIIDRYIRIIRKQQFQ